MEQTQSDALKKLYYNDKISKQKSNPKKLWKFINSVLSYTNKSKNKNVSKLIIDDKITEDLDEIASLFNNYFVDVGTRKINI